MAETNAESTYDSNLPNLTALKNTIVPLIENRLSATNIDFLSIEGRVKTKLSYLEKIRRKGYSDPPKQMTDACGVRVITYFPSQVEQISAFLRTIFQIDEKNSNDRISDLGSSRVGYQSIHLVCKLGKDRKKLPEYQEISDISFEIQIRTILQHAWAELAHDGSYKFSGSLPIKLQRTLNLQAGALELIDDQLDQISREIEGYEKELRKSETVRDAENVNIVSLRALYFDTINDDQRNDNTISNLDFDSLVEEVRNFGISSIGDLSALIGRELKEKWEKEGDSTLFGFLRDILLFADIEKYFSKSYKADWGGLEEEEYGLLCEKYGKQFLDEILSRHEIDIQREDF